MSDSLTPADVFTLKIPIRDTNIYAKRGDAQDQLQKALSRGLVPVIFGEYGVGKTSMARHESLAAERTGRLVNMESVKGKNFADVLSQCLETMGYRVEGTVTQGKTETITGESTGSTGVGGGLATVLNASVNAEVAVSAEWTKHREVVGSLVVTSPTDSKVLALCEGYGLVLLLDELHQASGGFREHLSAFLKAYANRGCSSFKIVLLGTSSDATELVRRDPGIDRLLQEVALGAMTDKEATEVVRRGMEALQISINSELVSRIVRTAVGSPTLLQFVCLEVAEAAYRRTGIRVAAVVDFEAALKEYIKTRATRLKTLYATAIETTGDKRYRKQIVRAVAECPNEYVTMQDITARVSTYVGEDVPSSAISGPLRQLKNRTFGPILKDVERPGEGGRAFNYTTFVDPSMKAFIRMLATAEADGVPL